MNMEIATALLENAMQTPLVVDDLWQIANGTPTDRHGETACLRLDKQLGGEGTPTSDIAIELSFHAQSYINFLMETENYPINLKKKAYSEFPPFGHDPQWAIPNGFYQDGWFMRQVEKLTNPQVSTKLRRRGSLELITIDKPSVTNFTYPWQQAISAHFALTLWDPQTQKPIYPRISSCYVPVGNTKAYEVCYRYGLFEVVKTGLLIGSGVECMFQFQSNSLKQEKYIFDEFIRGIQ